MEKSEKLKESLSLREYFSLMFSKGSPRGIINGFGAGRDGSCSKCLRQDSMDVYEEKINFILDFRAFHIFFQVSQNGYLECRL